MEAVKSRLARGYSRSAPFYDEVAGRMYLASIQRLLTFVRLPPMPAILDVGCGTGLNLVEAARRYGPARLLAGIDISPGMVAVARAKMAALGLPAQIIEGDAERLPYPSHQFDLVICNSVFHWFRDRPAAMQEIARVLRPGGQVALISATAPGFGEWFTLIDALVRSTFGEAYAPTVPDLPTGPEIGMLMHQAGLRVKRFRNPVHRTLVQNPALFVQLMSIIAPHWAADLPESAVVQLQQAAVALIQRGWPAGFPLTWSAVEAIGVKP
ncbi:MAG: class I SAM-dependent methyltransferase [Bacillota bacterium]